MKMFVAAIALFAIAAIAPTSASAWSEANCRSECYQTSTEPLVCIGYWNCIRFRGQPDVGAARVRALSQKWLRENGGKWRPR
jgi:hypothetical protein